MKLRKILFVCISTPVLVTLVVSGILIYSILERYLQNHEREQLEISVRNFAEQIFPYIQPVIRKREAVDLVSAYALIGDFKIRVYDKEWNLITRSDILNVQNINSDDPYSGYGFSGSEKSLDLSGSERVVWHIKRKDESSVNIFDFTYVCSLSKYTMNSQVSGSRLPNMDVKIWKDGQKSVMAEIDGSSDVVGYIEMSHLSDRVFNVFAMFPKVMVIVIGFSGIFAVLGALFVSKSIATHLVALTDLSSRISSGDFTIIPMSKRLRIDELKTLYSGFETMANQLHVMIDERDTERKSLRMFFDDAAHEMRTPLTAISNYVELLQGAAADDNISRIRFLSDCALQIEKLEWINKNLLDLARLDSNMSYLNKNEYYAVDLLTHVQRMHDSQLARKEMIVRLSVDPQLIIFCDWNWIVLALSNLLDNAIKYSRQRTKIDLEAKQSISGSNIELIVRDEGPGITKDFLPLIFERFTRGQTGIDGCGLGLSMALSVARRHDGEIAVESEIGRGSVFSLRLPVVSSIIR